MIIVLPLPHPNLNPNRKCHFMKKARHTKKARRDAKLAATHSMYILREPPRWRAATAQCRFYFRKSCGQDGDNALASVKAYFDGITDAGVWVNDKYVRHLETEIHFDKSDPRVEIEVQEVE